MDLESIISKQKGAGDLLKVDQLPPLDSLSGLPQEVKQAKADKKFRKLNKEPTTAKQLIARPDNVQPQLTVDPLPPIAALSGLKEEARGAKAAQVVSQIKGANKALADGDPSEAETIMDRPLTDEELVNGRVGVPNRLEIFAKKSTEDGRLGQIQKLFEKLTAKPSSAKARALVTAIHEIKDLPKPNELRSLRADWLERVEKLNIKSKYQQEIRAALESALPDSDEEGEEGETNYEGEEGEGEEDLNFRVHKATDLVDRFVQAQRDELATLHGLPKDVPIDEGKEEYNLPAQPPGGQKLRRVTATDEVNELYKKFVTDVPANPSKDVLRKIVENLQANYPEISGRGQKQILSALAATKAGLQKQIADTYAYATKKGEQDRELDSETETGEGLKKTITKYHMSHPKETPFSGTMSARDKADMKHQYRILTGEIDAGNDSRFMRAQLRDLIMMMMDNQLLTTSDVASLMEIYELPLK